MSLFITACNENINTRVYKDHEAKTEERVNDLLKRMTLVEKIAQLSEASCDGLKEDNQARTIQFSFDKYKNGVGTIDGFTLSVKELEAFRKVSIPPGDTRQVEFEINLKDCGYYNNKGKYLLEPGNFNIMAGSSSGDINFNKVIYVK